MKELTVKAVTDNITTVTDFIDAELEKIGCPVKIRLQIDIAIDEIFSNISYYAYSPGLGDATIRFETDSKERSVVISFIDRGRPFNPIECKDPDTALDIKARSTGGLGIFMVKKSMDLLNYEYVDGKNILRIKKRL